MRALVTGGAGFLGSHLCRRLLDHGFDVVCMDNLCTGRRSNIAVLEGKPGFTFVEQDVSRGIPFDGPLDRVWHLAAPASPPAYMKIAIETLDVGSFGTKNALELALAKRARFFLASTSEVYGDPPANEHPQKETYWGNVNSVGPRSMYDESKRFAEALTTAYRHQRGADVRIVRIFNSILGDEQILYDDGTQLRRETAAELARRLLLAEGDRELHGVTVPSFGPNGTMAARPASAFVAHRPPPNTCIELRTRYGRSVRVTSDHSVFVRGPEGPVATSAGAVAVGQHIAIAGHIRVPERDRTSVDAVEMLAEKDDHDIFVFSEGLGDVAWSLRASIVASLKSEVRAAGNGRPAANAYAWSEVQQARNYQRPSLWMLRNLGIGIPHGARVGLRSHRSSLPARVEITDSLLWFFGMLVAEGGWGESPNDSFITLASDDYLLERAGEILRKELGVHVTHTSPSPTHGPSIRVSSWILVRLLKHLELLSDRKKIPGWILGLPLSRLKHFIEGYREGDGVHSGKKLAEGVRHEFSTTSEALKNDLIVALGRFGLVPSVGRYTSTIKRYPDKIYPFWKLTIPMVSPWSPLEWDAGVTQKLNAARWGDLVWALVTEVHELPPQEMVYDFCVPGTENFIAGTGVLCHNTYGPFLKPEDGRVVSNFIAQALTGRPLTIFGDGSQTRSLCYVSDLIDGFWKLMEESTEPEPTNLGNPEEYTIAQLAQIILELTGSKSAIEQRPLPGDDPRQRKPDISKAMRVLGWSPKISAREGLARTIEWYRTLPPAELGA